MTHNDALKQDLQDLLNNHFLGGVIAAPRLTTMEDVRSALYMYCVYSVAATVIISVRYLTARLCTLQFNRRPDAEVQLLRDHYAAQSGDVVAFLLPQIVWAGHSTATFGLPVDGYFRYRDVLQESTDPDGWINVSVPLLAINDPGIA